MKNIFLAIGTALLSSICCITPVLALIAGTSGLASSFSWLEPFRPYLIGLTILVLGFAWYQKLKAKKEIEELKNNNEKLSVYLNTMNKSVDTSRKKNGLLI